MKNNVSHQGFVSSIGALVVAVGTAVGLGNIWKFPYEMGQNGGALFLIGYIIVTLVICIPLMIAEFSLGRAGKQGSIAGLKNLSPNTSWWMLGIVGIIANLFISFFYVVVGGWIMYYLYATLFMQITSQTDTALYFNNFINNKYGSMLGALSFLLLNFFISVKGVQKGLEKFSLWMIPLLGVFLIGLVIYSFTLPNVAEAMAYVFKPDFSKFTASGMVAIVGQAFFSLSLGVGAMILYGSYMLKTDNLVKTAINTSLISAVVVSILSSILVFNISFAYDIPEVAGPGLIFMAFPKVFAAMHGGYIIGIIFYILILLAALTSMLGMTEVPIAFFVSHKKMSRFKATGLVNLSVLVMGLLVILSMSEVLPTYKVSIISLMVFFIISLVVLAIVYPMLKGHIKSTYKKTDQVAKIYAIVVSSILLIIFLLLFFYNKNKNLFDVFDGLTSRFLIPIGGLLTAVFMGWIVNKKIIQEELNMVNNKLGFKYLLFINRYLIPLVIGVMIIYPFVTT
ncbi:sodium-dependent transporter [Rickettsiales bacterium LUAb2]